MRETVIRVQGLGKRYRLLHLREESYVALRDVLADKARALGRFLTGGGAAMAGEEEEFWALQALSFDVQQGEVVGIIGPNGAGKSTLLKILSRIIEPTAGSVRIRGRVASLLEVGTGFHPELTGRENIFLNGAILGMARAEIRHRFDEIVAFAGVEKFLDTPVKRYSSGMYVRLAFAVAAHLEPEILLVDEVLAVGDAEFQKKCIGKMQQVSQGLGRTVLFVSHNLGVVRTLCQRAVLLHRGRLEFAGPTEAALAQYASLVTQAGGSTRAPNADRPSIVGVRVDAAEACRGHLHVEVEFASPWPLDPVLVGAVIHDQLGAPLCGFNTWQNRGIPPQRARRGVATLRIPDLPLHTGVYRVAIFLGEKSQNHDVVENAAVLNFVAPEALPGGLSVDACGATRVNGAWTVRTVE